MCVVAQCEMGDVCCVFYRCVLCVVCWCSLSTKHEMLFSMRCVVWCTRQNTLIKFSEAKSTRANAC